MLLGSTRGAIHHLVKVARRVAFFAALGMQLLYIAYLVYITVKGAGIMGVNIAMIALSVGYLGYFLIMEYRLSGKRGRERRAGKRTSRAVKQIYRWIKLTFKTLNLGIMIYGLWVSEVISTTVSTIFTTLMIIVWVVELVIALGTVVIDYIENVIIDALEDDKNAMVDVAKTPGRVIKRVGRGFKRFLGFGGDDEPDEERYVSDEKYIRWEDELKEDRSREKMK